MPGATIVATAAVARGDVQEFIVRTETDPAAVVIGFGGCAKLRISRSEPDSATFGSVAETWNSRMRLTVVRIGRRCDIELAEPGHARVEVVRVKCQAEKSALAVGADARHR